MGRIPTIPWGAIRCKKAPRVATKVVIKLLKNSFTAEELEYISEHPVFQKALDERHSTHEDFEHLVDIGELLLKQRKDFNL
jgi:hypothetical protein